MWKKSIPAWAVVPLLIALSVASVGLWVRFAPSRQTVDPKAPAVQAQDAPKTANLPLRSIQTTVKTVDKAEVEKRIPGAVSVETRTNPQKFTFPPVQLDGWEGRRIVTPVLDNATGEVHVDDHKLPPPWFQWKKEFVGDIRYLFVGDHTFEADLKMVPIRLNARDGGMTIDPYAFVGGDIRREDARIGGRLGIGVQVRF